MANMETGTNDQSLVPEISEKDTAKRDYAAKLEKQGNLDANQIEELIGFEFDKKPVGLEQKIKRFYLLLKTDRPDEASEMFSGLTFRLLNKELEEENAYYVLCRKLGQYVDRSFLEQFILHFVPEEEFLAFKERFKDDEKIKRNFVSSFLDDKENTIYFEKHKQREEAKKEYAIQLKTQGSLNDEEIEEFVGYEFDKAPTGLNQQLRRYYLRLKTQRPDDAKKMSKDLKIGSIPEKLSEEEFEKLKIKFYKYLPSGTLNYTPEKKAIATKEKIKQREEEARMEVLEEQVWENLKTSGLLSKILSMNKRANKESEYTGVKFQTEIGTDSTGHKAMMWLKIHIQPSPPIFYRLANDPKEQRRMSEQIWNEISDADLKFIARKKAEAYYERDKKNWLSPTQSVAIKSLYPAIIKGKIRTELIPEFAQYVISLA